MTEEADHGRWFLSWARTGVATAISQGRTIQPRVAFTRTEPNAPPLTAPPVDGPALDVAGPADAIGFDTSLVLREEPARGSTDATSATLAHIEFAHAHLPWQLSLGRSTATDRLVPWLALVVLRDDEGVPPRRVSGSGPAVITPPSDALPDVSEYWAWAHVEVRTTGSAPGDTRAPVDSAEAAGRAVAADLLTRDDRVLSRLLCPRKLELGTWTACVIPTTRAGRLAGLRAAGVGGETADPADATTPAWTRDTGPVDHPVYHWWTFSVTGSDSFEDLAKRLEGISDEHRKELEGAGLGSRTVDVGQPWPDDPDRLGPDRPAVLTTRVDGALRLVPRTGELSPPEPPEIWEPGPTDPPPAAPAGGP